MTIIRPVSITCFGFAALCVAAAFNSAKTQELDKPITPAEPSPTLLIESGKSQVTITSDANSFEQQCLSLLVAASTNRRIEFSHASDRLKTNAFAFLDEIVEIVADCPATAILIIGHTDSSGDDQGNLHLSKARANSVVTYMVERGISADRLKSFGAGSSTPLVIEDNARAREQNRRIEFEFSFAGGPQ